MDEAHLPSLMSAFTELPDPRDPRGVRHLSVDLVTISVLAVICGANTFPGIHASISTPSPTKTGCGAS